MSSIRTKLARYKPPQEAICEAGKNRTNFEPSLSLSPWFRVQDVAGVDGESGIGIRFRDSRAQCPLTFVDPTTFLKTSLLFLSAFVFPVRPSALGMTAINLDFLPEMFRGCRSVVQKLAHVLEFTNQ